jgi:CheY-like chemotaxis protein
MLKQRSPKHFSHEPVSILLVGNNPIEMSRTLDLVKKLPGRRVVTEIAFDLASVLQRLISFRPSLILIDDNIGVSQVGQTVRNLSNDPKTRDVPIAILKNNNYSSSLVINEPADYVLKQNLTLESIYTIFKNAIRLKQARIYFAMAYKKRKRQLLRLID